MDFVGTSMIGFSGSSSSVMTTTYLSTENSLTQVNESFSSKEYALYDEIESVNSNYPGYDEYVINADNIGHDTHELLSYLTARCGVIENANDVEPVLNELFDEMYDISYNSDSETRYKTVTEKYVDEDGNVSYESHTESYEYTTLTVTLTKKELDTIARDVFSEYPNNLVHYESLLAAQGNMASVFGSGNSNEIISNPNFENPGIAFDDETVKALFNEAEKHIGKTYVFGGNGPDHFDCSSFVCWSFTKSGVKNMPRTTAWRIYTDYCNPVSPDEAKAGDIIFFTGTYDSGTPISHVALYAGDGMMLHAGDPIRYTSINSNYWQSHFYAFGRVKD